MEIKEIKRFNSRAFNAVSRLLPQLDTEAGTITKVHFMKIIKSKGTHLFVAEQEGVIIGMMTIVMYYVPSATRFWIEDVIVDESQRGKGLGKEFISFAIDYARFSGAKKIDLTSRPFRIAANQLYRKSGFDLRETNVYRYTFR